MFADVVEFGRFGPARADQGQDGIDHALADRHAAQQVLGRQHLVGGHHFDRLFFVDTGGSDQHAALGRQIRVGDIDLHEEAVKLGLGQRIGALLLQRVLGRQHMERRRQRVALAGDGDFVLLHGLEQGRLGARAGPVDLVGHQ